jgi:leucyl aminopeptidase
MLVTGWVDSRAVLLEVSSKPLEEFEVDLAAIGLTDRATLPPALGDAPGADDVKMGFKDLAILHPERPSRVLVVGLGGAEDLDAERLRVAAALAAKRARSHEARSIAWSMPGHLDEPVAGAALVEGTVLASYRFDRYRSRKVDDRPRPDLERLVLTDAGDPGAIELEARPALVAAQAANRARELQDLAPNELTPTALAERAEEVAGTHEALTVEVLGPKEIAAHGMGGLVAVSKGSAEEPRLIVLRYSADGGGETLGLVGKAVTFDTGGISIKPSASMHEMKMDMSGGAAVIEAIGAIAELGLPLEIVGVIPATENMPGGRATKPGDVIRHLNGKTVEVINTDAEGRLILADALTYCARDLGADRLIDVATLTGGVVVALGSTYAGLMSNDEQWAEGIARAGEETGELAWRLPLHPEYKELTKSAVADLANSSGKRKASSIYAASFLEEFVEGRTWAHLDVAGTAWDVGREYVGQGATGFGVRLLVRRAPGPGPDPCPAARRQAMPRRALSSFQWFERRRRSRAATLPGVAEAPLWRRVRD